MRKLCIFFALLFALLSLIVNSGNAAAATVAAGNEFDRTNVLDDLQSLEGFNANDYVLSTDGNAIEILHFIEYCYAFKPTQRQNYAIYLYIFNRHGASFDTTSTSNSIQIATAYNETGEPSSFAKFEIEYISSVTTGQHKGKFLKFKVKNTSEILAAASSHATAHGPRRYDVSSIEIRTVGENNATDYAIGGTWKYSGYSAGYGPDVNAESTLTCEVSEFETLELQVQGTYYRYQNSPYTSDQVNSVYFSVPSAVSAKYGNLQKVKAEWYEYKTKPILVTNDSSMYADFHNYLINKQGSLTNKDYTLMLSLGWFLNLLAPDVPLVLEQFRWVFSAGANINATLITQDEISKWIDDYSKNNTSNLGLKDLENENISADLFLDKVDEGRELGYNLVEIDVADGFDLLGSGLSDFINWFAEMLFGIDFENSSISSITPIYNVTQNDLQMSNKEISEKLLVAAEDIEAFKSYCDAEFARGNDVYLFRFGVTKYLAAELNVKYESHFLCPGHTDVAYLASETVFINWDIISLTYKSEADNNTVLACVSDPVDLIATITAPGGQSGNSAPFPIALTVALGILILIQFVCFPSKTVSHAGLKRFFAIIFLLATIFLLAGAIVYWIGLYDFATFGIVFEWLINFVGGLF